MSNGMMENAVLLRLEFRKAGNTVKGDKTLVTTEADKAFLKLSKVLFDCDEFAAIGTFDSELRKWVTARCITVNVGFSGVYILPNKLLADVERKLSDAKDERRALVNAFLAVYDAEKEAARGRLANQFRESDYPAASTMAEKFGLGWKYVTLGVPDSLPPEIREREAKARQDEFRNMETECRAALREGLSQLLGHLAASLEVGADGKKKIFRDSAVGNVVEFLDLLAARDITNDSELRGLADKAKDILKDATPDRLRDDVGFRAAVREQVSSVAGNLAALVGVEQKRKLNLDLED